MQMTAVKLFQLGLFLQCVTGVWQEAFCYLPSAEEASKP